MSSYAVDRRKWAQLSILEQMGNIGSEVGRSIKAKTNGDDQAYQAALLRAKDQYLQLFYNPKLASQAEAKKLENYFTQFAIAARANR